ncbi:hypothetical protein GCM10019059_43730 [Camelimonas fluminis]|uniref:TPM domain-containing protein n=1 Tax=Camelimonas fluminis TaxID=1576911 RepID=A0ABV7UKA4_9HYPH|nr:TPM domain-containing protein [Camelimonas fluminis]GHE80892.1 hypothetical protein GCM10019059_43730 [Camelimonas fluminis]
MALTGVSTGFWRRCASALALLAVSALLAGAAVTTQPGSVAAQEQAAPAPPPQNAPQQPPPRPAPAPTPSPIPGQDAAPQDGLPGKAQFPRLTGRVVDAAHILDAATRERISARLAAYEAKTSDQVVVATVPSLDGLPIEDYANRLFRQWGLGTREKNNGALLLVAPRERKVRIEVGYGVEGGLTDAIASVIINSAIIPKFRQGDFSGGVEAGANAVVDVLTGDAGTWSRRAEARAEERGPSIMAVIFYVILLLIFIRIMSRMAGGGGGRNGMHRSRTGRWGPVVLPPVGGGWGGGWGGGFGGGGGGFDSGGFSGGGGSSGGGGASGSW